MLSASSPLTRLAQSRAMRRLRRCHTCCETLLADPSPSSKSAACAPAAPAHHPRDRASQYNTSSPLHKAMNRATKGVTVHASPSGRVMLSATLISDDNAHHQIRHRARHGLRGGVAFATSRFAPVVPCSAVLLPESTRGDGGSPNPSGASAAPPASSTAPVHHSLLTNIASATLVRRRCIHTASFHSLSSSSQSSHTQDRLRRSTRGKRNPAHRPLTPSAFQAACRFAETSFRSAPR